MDNVHVDLGPETASSRCAGLLIGAQGEQRISPRRSPAGWTRSKYE
jgi:hypothetical protein